MNMEHYDVVKHFEQAQAGAEQLGLLLDAENGGFHVSEPSFEPPVRTTVFFSTDILAVIGFFRGLKRGKDLWHKVEETDDE